MASVLDRYGIKEVADVTFYELKGGKPAYPVLYCDTLKVSTIEQTADEATANGGKGNVALISWDYNKDINVTIEDALFSAKSMAILFGNGKAHDYADFIMKTEVFKATAGAAVVTLKNATAPTAGWNPYFEGPDGTRYKKYNPKFYKDNTDGNNNGLVTGNLEKDETYFCTYDLLAKGSVIKVGASTFPGTYYVVGDTYARSQADGKDEFFQFIISKAKITSENTITMEADGDPSVFNMNLHVLRPESGDMMKLVKYDLVGGTSDIGDTIEVYHNHVLVGDSGMGSAETDKATAEAEAEAIATGNTDNSINLGRIYVDVGDTSGTGLKYNDVAINGTSSTARVVFDNDEGLESNLAAEEAQIAIKATGDTFTDITFRHATVTVGDNVYKVEIAVVPAH